MSMSRQSVELAPVGEAIKPVVVIGGGPAGLMAAWELVNKRLPVVLVEMRGVCRRSGVITSWKFGNDERIAELYEGEDPLEIPTPPFQIRQCERFLWQQLERHAMPKDGVSTVTPGHVRLLRGYEFIGFDDAYERILVRKVSARHVVSLAPSLILDCSGSTQQVLRVLPNHTVERRICAEQPTVSQFGFFIFKDKLRDFILYGDHGLSQRQRRDRLTAGAYKQMGFYQLERRSGLRTLHYLINCLRTVADPRRRGHVAVALQRNYFPFAYTTASGQSGEVALYFELPQSIADLPAQDDLKLALARNYAKKLFWLLAHISVGVVGDMMNYDEFAFSFIRVIQPTRTRSHGVVFETQLWEASRSVVRVKRGSDRQVILMGDSGASALHLVSNGLNRAMYEATMVAQYCTLAKTKESEPAHIKIDDRFELEEGLARVRSDCRSACERRIAEDRRTIATQTQKYGLFQRRLEQNQADRAAEPQQLTADRAQAAATKQCCVVM